MKEKVYLDSTIPSYFFDDRDSIQPFIRITRDWWNNESKNYEVWISEAVIQELSAGNYPHKKRIIDFVTEVPILSNASDLAKIVEFYIENHVMPKSFLGDAAHLAYASYYNIDYLLTWNCNHLANANKRKHIRVINGRLGLSSPEIVTPMELFKEIE